jgi:hypothetical protein
VDDGCDVHGVLGVLVRKRVVEFFARRRFLESRPPVVSAAPAPATTPA